MTDDERFAGRYREQAIRYAALHQLQPVTYVLICRGCRIRLTASDTRHFRAQERLVNRALRAGWETDARGHLCCRTCFEEMLARAAKRIGSAAAQGEGG